MTIQQRPLFSNRITLIPIAVLACALPARGDFTAYNDCAMSSTGNVTSYQTFATYTASGLLKDNTSGLASGVTCTATASGGALVTTDLPPQFAAGTDAATLFNGKITYAGSQELNSDTDWFQYTFTGLDPTKTYEFAATANKAVSTYTTRVAKYTLAGVAAFVNSSSAGATKSTTTVANDTTTFSTGYNTFNGYVAHWTEIAAPGGTFSVKVSRAPGIRGYGFGMFMFKESTPVPVPVVAISAGEWHTPTIWNPAVVPSSLSLVTVDAFNVDITASAAVCNTLTLNGGVSVAVSGQTLNIGSPDIGALNTAGGSLLLYSGSTVNVANANTSASLKGVSVAFGNPILNITGELTVDANVNLSGAVINTPKLTLAGGELIESAGLSFGSGKLISGNGTINGSVTLGSGGKASPGTDTTINAISVNSLTLDSGSLLTLNAASAASLDQITVSGVSGLTINGGVITLLDATGTNPVAETGTFNLFAYSGSISGAGVSALSVANKLPGRSYTFDTAGGYVTLTIGLGYLWSGADGAVWSLAENWSGTMPGPGDTLVYAVTGLSGSSVNDLSGASFPSIEFESGAGAFTLSGNKVILSGDTNGAAVVNYSTEIQTLSLPIQLNASRAVNAANGAVVLGGELSGAGTLVKSGTSALTLSGTNIHTGGVTLSTGTLNLDSTAALGATAGTFTITGGTIDNKSAGDVVLSNNNPLSWTGNFTFTGTNNLGLGTGAITMTGDRTATVSAKTLALGGKITGTGILGKAGAGALVLSSASNSVGTVNVTGGQLTLDNSLAASPSLSTTSAIAINGAPALLDVNNATVTAPGVGLSNGQLILEGSSVLNTTGNVGGYNDSNAKSLYFKNTATINGSTTTLNTSYTQAAQSYYIMLQDNAQATFSSVGLIYAGEYSDGRGHSTLMEVKDSAKLTTTGNLWVMRQANDRNRGGTMYDFAHVYQHGGTVTVGGTLSLTEDDTAVGSGAGAVHETSGSYDLGAGGSLKVAGRILGGAVRTGYGQSFFNFHGGTLTYTGGGAQSDWINLTATAGTAGTTSAANLRVWEGGTIDTGAQNLTVTQALLAPTGSGVSAIDITGLTTVYNNGCPPYVYITRGAGDTTGSGASAVATLDATGHINGITIITPGNDYTVTPTVVLTRNGGGVAVPAENITLAANAYTGGLTKMGAGKLTLNAGNTYAGASTISGGTLALGASGTLAAASSVSIAAGATFDVTALTVATTYNWSTSSLSASGTGTDAATAATLAGTAGGTVNMGATPVLLTWSGAASGTDAAHPPLTVSGAALTLGGNEFTVAVPGTALGAGVYTLVSAGLISGGSTVNPTPLFTGSGMGSGGSGVVSISGNSVILTVSGSGTPYENWAATHAGGQAANLDWDKDGVPNGVEYFMGAAAGFTANPKVVTVGSVRTVTWPRDPSATITSWMVQVSDTLAANGWTNVVPPNASIDTTDPTKVVYTLPTGTKKFCRLLVVP